MKQPAIDVLRCCARVLDASRVAHRAVDRRRLDRALTRLRSVARGRYRDDVTQILGEDDDETAVAVGRTQFSRRTIATTIRLTGSVSVAAAAAADARPVWARALGLRLPDTGIADRLIPETVAVAAIPTGFLANRSVAARNSLRTGIGFGAGRGRHPPVPGAARLLGRARRDRRAGEQRIEHWNQSDSGSGRYRRGSPSAECSSRPSVFSPRCSGRCCRSPCSERRTCRGSRSQQVRPPSRSVLIILNIVAPTGWQIGLLRIKDVAIGAVVAIVVSLLLWPRGATAAVSAVIDTALQVNSRF